MTATCKISPKAKIGKHVSIGPFSVIHDHVVIEDYSIIGSHCLIGVPARAAQGKPFVLKHHAHIRSHSILYEGSTLGAHLTTGHHVILREKTTLGEHVQIGSSSIIEGDCRIGRYVRMHSFVHVVPLTQIGDFVWIFPRVQFTNDPWPPSDRCQGVIVKDMAVIATGAILLPGITVGLGSFIGAGSLVTRDVPDVSLVFGSPARVINSVEEFIRKKHHLPYPWPKHFRSHYPTTCYPKMNAIVRRIEILLKKNQKRSAWV